LAAPVWQAEVESHIRGGTGADRSLELSGDELGQGQIGREEFVELSGIRAFRTRSGGQP
jgi:hypothetical protein